jgi:CRP-like cAMP-binding protein
VGEEIVTEGREGSTFFVLLSGRVSVKAKEREVATLGAGQSFGEMSLLTGEPRSATVSALEDTVLLELGRDVFATHFAAHPERAAQLAEVLEQRKAALSAASTAGAVVEGSRSSRVIDRLREIFRLRA